MSNYICHGFDKQRGESWEARLACYGWLVCVCMCLCACCASEWGHVWLQPLILPDAFGMMRLSAPGNPLNVFIQAACISHSHTHAHRRSASLVLKYFWLAEVVSSRSLFYFVSNFRVWGELSRSTFISQLLLCFHKTLSSSSSYEKTSPFYCHPSWSKVLALFRPLPLSQFPELARDETKDAGRWCNGQQPVDIV